MVKIKVEDLVKIKVEDLVKNFPDNESCVEWLKNQRYPEGIKCLICKKVTKHHKMFNRPYYVCDNCGHHVYPAAGTIFSKSTTPLKTWFKVINMVFTTGHGISAKEIQREYGMTYKTAWRMVSKIEELLNENTTTFINEDITDKAEIDKASVNNPRINISENVPINAKDTSHRTEESSFGRDLGKFPLYTKENLKEHQSKRDRTARLLKLQILLWQHSGGLKIEELARKCSTSKRTVYRDLKVIESELGIPIWEEGNKRGIVEGYFLPPITFSSEEAFDIFLESRLLQKQYHIYNPTLTSIFMKIGAIVPPALRNKIQDSMEYIEQRPIQKDQIRNLYLLAHAWLSQHQVKIHYQERLGSEATEFIIEPYFMDPSLFMHTITVIAYYPLKKSIYSFNINRIIGKAIICPGTYEIPTDFNPVDSINSAWGMPIDGDSFSVKLHFKPRVSQMVMSTIWHPSQITELQIDGSLLATFKVRKRSTFLAWVLSWGNEVEVLEPKEFREDIVNFAKVLMQVYSQ